MLELMFANATAELADEARNEAHTTLTRRRYRSRNRVRDDRRTNRPLDRRSTDDAQDRRALTFTDAGVARPPRARPPRDSSRQQRTMVIGDQELPEATPRSPRRAPDHGRDLRRDQKSRDRRRPLKKSAVSR